MVTPTWGIVEGAQRARDWMPLLGTEGQRLILACVVLFMNADSTSDPTIDQLVAVSRFHRRSVRRLLKQLEELGALSLAGTRPVHDSKGVGRGGKVNLWSVPPAPNEAHLALAPNTAQVGNSQVRPGEFPSAPGSAANGAQLGALLSTELTEQENLSCAHEFEDSGPNGKFRVCRLCGSSSAKQRAAI